MTISELMNLSPSKPIPKQVKEAVGHVVNIEAKRSTSKNRMITLPMKKSQVIPMPFLTFSQFASFPVVEN